MDKKKLFKVSALGVAALGISVIGAVAGQFSSPQLKVSLETINATSGKNVNSAAASFFLNTGFPNGSVVTIDLSSNAKFDTSTGLAICYSGSPVTNASNLSRNNSTVTFTTNAYVPGSQWLVLGNGSCANLPIIISGNVNDGDSVTISGFVNGTGEPITPGTLYVIKQQTTANYTKGTSYISYSDNLQKFTNGVTQSNAILYISNASLDVSASNGNFTITVTGDSFAGVSNGIWGNSTHNCTLSLSSDKTNLTGTCPMSNVTDSNAKLTINVYGNETLSARKFYTTIKTKADNSDFAREITLLNQALTHEWLLQGTTFYIPFVRHNPTQNIYTTIKLQAASSHGITSYPISVQVLKSDGTLSSVNVCGGQLNAGQTCQINGNDLISAAGKEETFAIINVSAPEDKVSCYAVYSYSNQYRRVPCKVKGGTIVE